MTPQKVILEKAAQIDWRLKKERRLNNLVHPRDRKPMTKEEFREAVMRERVCWGWWGDALDCQYTCSVELLCNVSP